MSLAALARSARVAAMRARALRPLPQLALAEQIWKAAHPDRFSVYAMPAKYSEYCRFMRWLAVVRAWAALRMYRDVGGRIWKRHIRTALLEARGWRKSATHAAWRGR